MQDWRKRDWQTLRYPRPIIEAFYVRKPQTPTKSLSDECHTSATEAKPPVVPRALGELRDLQRICINSEYLHQELMDISPIPLGRDTVM
jgi:hypothetical protein